ncbi:MAG: hypothetical protein SGPRY_014645, partial [Prymnesium sp.]
MYMKAVFFLPPCPLRRQLRACDSKILPEHEFETDMLMLTRETYEEMHGAEEGSINLIQQGAAWMNRRLSREFGSGRRSSCSVRTNSLKHLPLTDIAVSCTAEEDLGQLSDELQAPASADIHQATDGERIEVTSDSAVKSTSYSDSLCAAPVACADSSSCRKACLVESLAAAAAAPADTVSQPRQSETGITLPEKHVHLLKGKDHLRVQVPSASLLSSSESSHSDGFEEAGISSEADPSTENGSPSQSLPPPATQCSAPKREHKIGSAESDTWGASISAGAELTLEAPPSPRIKKSKSRGNSRSPEFEGRCVRKDEGGMASQRQSCASPAASLGEMGAEDSPPRIRRSRSKSSPPRLRLHRSKSVKRSSTRKICRSEGGDSSSEKSPQGRS